MVRVRVRARIRIRLTFSAFVCQRCGDAFFNERVWMGLKIRLVE
jgi:hypothetical protein